MRTRSLNADFQFGLVDLLRIQKSLWHKLRQIDPENICSIGFGLKQKNGRQSRQLAARVFVRKKKRSVNRHKLIPHSTAVRRWNTEERQYDLVEVLTDVETLPAVIPAAIPVRSGKQQAMTGMIVRWSHRKSPRRQFQHAGNKDWNWGVLTVAHLRIDQSATLTGLQPPGRSERPFALFPIAQGRIPGGPDVMLLEVDRDWLWYSGILPDPNRGALPMLAPADVLSWTRSPTNGYLHGPSTIGWKFDTYFPSLNIRSLGRLSHIIRFQTTTFARENPLAPGTSGAPLTHQGRPLGMLLASEQPTFVVGYTQFLPDAIQWLQHQLGAPHFEVVHVF